MGDSGYQLVFDDADAQLRMQFGSTQHATWLKPGPPDPPGRQPPNVQSANGHIDWAAAKRVTLQTAGGIMTQCPGKITVHAATKSMVGPGQEGYAVSHMPRAEISDTAVEFRHINEWGDGLAGVPFKAFLSDGTVRTGHLHTEGYARVANVASGTIAKVEYGRDRCFVWR